MMTETPKRRWWLRQLSEKKPHIDAVVVTGIAMLVANLSPMLRTEGRMALCLMDIPLLIIAFAWALLLDTKAIAGSVVLTALWMLSIGSMFFVLMANLSHYLHSISTPGMVHEDYGDLLWIIIGGFAILFPKLLLLLLGGLHTTIVIGRGIRDRFAREQAEIDAAEGVHDVGRPGFDHDNEEGDDDD